MSIAGSRSFKLLTTSHTIVTQFSPNYQCYLSRKCILMSLGKSVNKLNFNPILIKLSLNFNSIFIKLSPNFNSILKKLSLNWYKIASQILQNCHSSCITLLLIPLLSCECLLTSSWYIAPFTFRVGKGGCLTQLPQGCGH